MIAFLPEADPAKRVMIIQSLRPGEQGRGVETGIEKRVGVVLTRMLRRNRLAATHILLSPRGRSSQACRMKCASGG
jgi:hypothetical protein